MEHFSSLFSLNPLEQAAARSTDLNDTQRAHSSRTSRGRQTSIGRGTRRSPHRPSGARTQQSLLMAAAYAA